MSSSSTTMPIAQTEKDQDHLEPYDASHPQNESMLEGVLAVVRRPRYDNTFDVAVMMRESGYPEPFRLPKSVTVVKKRRDMIPLPGEEEVVSAGGYRGIVIIGSEMVLVNSLLDWSNGGIEFVKTGAYKAREPLQTCLFYT
ncbi:hypothetical protein KIN20_022737 [Parelaphostrongylus tenuis]|uniref:Uncharacterized protein n=1 Tax=Parelaphostrongylus tenuis TaxID=148309 RepID=A0AAD5QVE8_PARTN|nr:hypothetical protein KIN20_022737 [Parelaphostrongylus tenuis]